MLIIKCIRVLALFLKDKWNMDKQSEFWGSVAICQNDWFCGSGSHIVSVVQQLTGMLNLAVRIFSVFTVFSISGLVSMSPEPVLLQSNTSVGRSGAPSNYKHTLHQSEDEL